MTLFLVGIWKWRRGEKFAAFHPYPATQADHMTARCHHTVYSIFLLAWVCWCFYAHALGRLLWPY